MKMNGSQKIISIILICLVIVLITLVYINSLDIVEDETVNQVETVVKEKETLSEILAKYDIEYIRRESNKIYVNFNFQLYNEDGSSNETKINNLLNELTNYFMATYYIIDEKNNINITVFYNANGDNKTVINNKSDFYEVTDGKTYYDTNNVDIVPEKNIYVSDSTLQYITANSLRYTDLVKTLGEPTETDENGYLIFENGEIKVSKYEGTNMVRNMIYSGKYLTSFVSKIKENYSLETVIEAYGQPTFGSLNEEYVGYRTPEYYLFFYDNEISVYGYGYTSNIEFEKILQQYSIDRNLENLSFNIRALWRGYYKHEIDPENGRLYLSYPSRGLEIDIENNNSKGIKFYSNYYFSDDLLNKIKNGTYTLVADEDFIHIVEQERVGK